MLSRLQLSAQILKKALIELTDKVRGAKMQVLQTESDYRKVKEKNEIDKVKEKLINLYNKN